MMAKRTTPSAALATRSRSRSDWDMAELDDELPEAPLSKRAANAAVDRMIGDKASPVIKQAAAEALAPWVEELVRWLDDFIRIPGTSWGIGLDPILGMILPGAGDAITGVGSMALLWVAFKERIPRIVM